MSSEGFDPENVTELRKLMDDLSKLHYLKEDLQIGDFQERTWITRDRNSIFLRLQELITKEIMEMRPGLDEKEASSQAFSLMIGQEEEMELEELSSELQKAILLWRKKN